MFFQKHLFSFVSVVLLTFLAGCASPKAPTGGPKDETPPAVMEEESTSNFQTNFVPKEIVITFDEWFTLKDVSTQLIISPLMPQKPDVKQKGKSIIISVPDSLSEETTYTLNFGSAIADLNEGNILENYAFVFSTGDILDSVKLNGKVIDALTLTPAEGVWVMLYPVGEDSAVFKRKPEYVAKTNKEGVWSMANIRSDSFDLVALKDDNLNFLYDQETELIGWHTTPVITSTPIVSIPSITVFPKEKRIAIREVIHQAPGWLKMVVDAPIPKPIPQLIPPMDSVDTAWDGDTLHIWYDPDQNYAGKAIVAMDTTTIRTSNKPSLANATLTIAPVTGRLHPLAPAKFKTALPLVKADTSKIKLEIDSIGSLSYTLMIDSLTRRSFTIQAPWQPLSRHNLTILPGALQDVWGRTNDTIRQSIVVHGADQYGDLTIQVSGLDSTRNYILLLKSGEQVEARFEIFQQSTATLKKGGLTPGKFGIELIEDLNANGIWDTGDYSARRQPERKMLFTIDNVRAAWEVETIIVWQ